MSSSKLTIAGPALRLLQCGLIWCVLVSVVRNVHGIRARRSSFLDDDTAIHTELVDKNNRTIWAMFNLTETAMNRILAANNANSKESSAPPRDSLYFKNVKDYRVNDIRNRLESAFQVSTSDENQEHPLHEMAAYPICNTDSDESSWLHDNNVTIRFSDSLFEQKHDNLNLDSAILRLYKVNPNGTEDPNASDAVDNHKPKRCANPFLDSQIRVTVSIVQQMRRNKQRKKRICNTIMMNVSKTGWVEIDIKRAIYIWENVERQQQQPQQQPQQHQHQQQQQHQHQPQQQLRQPILVGWLMIEVHDEEERPLKPGLYFNPPKCDQADLAIPWNYYRPHAPVSSFTANEVPRYPRLDVKLIGYASFAPKNYNKQLHQKLRDNLRRQLYNLSKNSAEIEYETTTSIAPTADNMLESSASASTEIQHNHRKRHSHRYRHHADPEQILQQQQQQQLAQTPLALTQQAHADNNPISATAVAEGDQDASQHLHAHHRHRRQHNHHSHQQAQPQHQAHTAADC